MINEKFTIEIEGATFICQKLTPVAGINWLKLKGSPINRILTFLKYSVLDWKNVKDAKGQSVPFKKGLLGTGLPLDIFKELAEKLLEKNNVLMNEEFKKVIDKYLQN